MLCRRSGRHLLGESFSQIRSGMASAGVQWFSFSADSGRRTGIWTFQPLSLDSCTIQIQVTHEDAAYAQWPASIFNGIWTIPLGQLDLKKLRASYRGGWSKSLTSSQDWELGYFSVTLQTLGLQRTISSVGSSKSNDKAGRSVTGAGRSYDVSYVEIDRKTKSNLQRWRVRADNERR